MNKLIEHKTILEGGSGEIIINKSRFLGYSSNAENPEMAEVFISQIRKKHFDATHNCWAYVIGSNFGIQKASDDGEPSGTAGIPILEVMKKEEITNAVIVVTRYFGGVKLGAGGLIRAYTQGAKIALENGKIVEKLIYIPLDIISDYTNVGKLNYYIGENNILNSPSEFMQKVKFKIYLPKDEVGKIEEELMHITSGQLEIARKNEIFVNKNGSDIFL